MEPITIVKRRSPLLPILLTLLLVALVVLGALWMLGMLPGVEPPRFGAVRLLDPGSLLANVREAVPI